MKTPSIIVAAIVVLVVGGVVLATQLNKNSDSGMKDMSSMDKEGSMSGDMMSEMDLTNQSEVTMDVQDFKFEKANIKIKTGTKVTWTNQDSAKHNVVTDGEGAEDLASELLAKGESYSYTFTKVGVTNYLCEPHPYMKGFINVVE